MSARLPRIPAEALDISTRELRRKMARAVRLAEIFGHWRRPKTAAAAMVEEMGVPDMLYWAYKAKHPIQKMEKGCDPRRLFVTDSRLVGLPEGFETQTNLTFGCVGDLLQADGLELSRNVLFESVADLLFGQDIAFANIESPITRQPLVKEVISDRAPPMECCDEAQFETLASHKGRWFDVLNTSNNHTFDMGFEGLGLTLETLAARGILDLGTNARPEDHGRAKTLTRNDVKVGFAAATFGLNSRDPPEEDRWRINVSKLSSVSCPPDLDLLKRQIDDCRAQDCDFVIASVHWGYEFELFPRRLQVEAARALAEYGADAVLCHHPHVVQPVEYWRPARDPHRVVPIAYSLGSLTWGFTAPWLALNMILDFTLAKGRLEGRSRTYLSKATVTPTFRSAADVGDKTETRIEILADHLDGKSRRHTPDYIAAIKRYADLVLEARTEVA